MPLLTKEQILKAPDLQIEKVEVPEWGGHIFVRGMTGTERDDWEQEITPNSAEQEVLKKDKSKKHIISQFRSRVVCRCACDEKGSPLFTKEDVEVLGKKSALALDKVFSTAKRLSGIGAEEQEEVEKNLEPTKTAGSTSS